jgi:tetratricopeptide (TPR) repeat protein
MLKNKIFRPNRTFPFVFLALVVLQAAGCSSPEERAKNYYQHGLKLLSEHDQPKAALEFRNAVKLKRDLIEAWKALAEIDETSRNWSAVLSDLRAIVELTPNDVSARLKLGKLLLLAGSTQEARRLAEAGIEIDNRNSDLHALKAAVAFKLNNQAEATREAQSAIELDPTNVDALMVLAVDRSGRGDAKGALSLLQEPFAGGKEPENNFAFELLKIKLLGQTGNMQNLETPLKKLVEQSPQDRAYRQLLIRFYVEQRRADEAEKELRSLADLHPSHAEGTLDLVRFLYTIKKSPAAARQELNTRINAGGEVFPYQLALADMDLAEGNNADGKQLLESLIRGDRSPEHIRAAKIKLAQMYFGERTFGSAENLANDVLLEEPHHAPALKLRASIRLERGQPEAAVSDLVTALNYQPRSVDLILLLATAYERNGLMELADKQFADAIRVSNFDVKIGLDYAAFLQRRGAIARAENILTELNKRQPNNIQVLSALGQVRLARQNWTGAQEIAESIRLIGNNSGTADQLLGAALIGRSKYDEAIVAFQNAYDAAPATAQPIDSLVGAYLKANKKDQAIAFLKSVLAKNPKNANAIILLGSIQASSDAADQALKSFLAAVEAQPTEAAGYQALAGFYLKQGNYDKAIEVIRTAIGQQPKLMALRVILAHALERKEDYEAAISEYEAVLEDQPNNLIVANNLASLLLDHRTDQASIKKAQSLAAALRKSQIPQFKDTVAWASYQQRDFRTAVALSEEAAAALPEQAAVRYHLGMGYIATGQLGKASEQLKKAQELTPNSELAELIRSALKKAGS